MYVGLKDLVDDSHPIHDRVSDLTQLLRQLQTKQQHQSESDVPVSEDLEPNPYESPDESVFRSPPVVEDEGDDDNDRDDLATFLSESEREGKGFDLRKSGPKDAKIKAAAQLVIDTIKTKGNPGLCDLLTNDGSELLVQIKENGWTVKQVLQTRTRKSQTATQIAVLLGMKRVLETLFQFGADPMTVDLQANTLLHLCCSNAHSSIANRIDILDLILSQPTTDPNALSANLLTPLHLLVSNSPSAQVFGMIKKLIDRGADPNIEMEAGPRNPLATVALKHLKTSINGTGTQDKGSNRIFVPFSRFLMNPMLSDLQIRVGDKIFPVHKIVLAAQSQIFRSMFESGWKETESKTIDLLDVTPETFKLFLTFLYTGECPITFDAIKDAIELLMFSQKHLLDPLIDHCQRFLLKTLSVESAFAVFSLASELHCDDLASAAGNFILSNYRELCTYDEDHVFLFKVLERVFV